MSRTLAITGAAGFVGINLTRAALESGYRVVLYDIADRFGRPAYAKLPKGDEAKLCELDLSRAQCEFPADAVAVIHLAALPHVDYSLREPRTAVTNNVISTSRVLDEASRREIPLLFASSAEVFGGHKV